MGVNSVGSGSMGYLPVIKEEPHRGDSFGDIASMEIERPDEKHKLNLKTYERFDTLKKYRQKASTNSLGAFSASGKTKRSKA